MDHLIAADVPFLANDLPILAPLIFPLTKMTHLPTKSPIYATDPSYFKLAEAPKIFPTDMVSVSGVIGSPVHKSPSEESEEVESPEDEFSSEEPEDNVPEEDESPITDKIILSDKVAQTTASLLATTTPSPLATATPSPTNGSSNIGVSKHLVLAFASFSLIVSLM
jgi:hypothetical protein